MCLLTEPIELWPIPWFYGAGNRCACCSSANANTVNTPDRVEYMRAMHEATYAYKNAWAEICLKWCRGCWRLNCTRFAFHEGVLNDLDLVPDSVTSSRAWLCDVIANWHFGCLAWRKEATARFQVRWELPPLPASSWTQICCSSANDSWLDFVMIEITI